jgi:cell division protein FtsI/penicillin-binding protein 2
LPAILFGLVTVVISARLVQLQVFRHDYYARLSRAEQTGTDTFYARRGAILDRNGNVLAASVDTWDIYVNARAWQDPNRAVEASNQLSRLIPIEASFLRETVANSKSIDVLISRDVEYEIGSEILRQGIDGVIARRNTARVNPEGDLGASVVGFIGLDNQGLSGVEQVYDATLQGTPGRAVYERDTTGAPIPYGQYLTEDPVPGKDVILTIDRFLQQLAERKLAEAIKLHQAKGGALIVMDPNTGAILAIATSPGLKYSDLPIEDEKELELLRNRAVTDVYEPGSVMKVITAAAAIDKGVVTPDTTYVDTGEVQIYERTLRNFDNGVWGTQSMTGVLQHSINTGAVFMVNKIGRDAFHSYLDQFGFGAPSGIDLAGEAIGIIRRPEEPGWSPVDLATQSFGQSISVTPIQMITAIATVINGGHLVRPHVVGAYIDANGIRQDVKPEFRGQVISAEASATLRQMMADVLLPDGYPTPGKPKNYTAGGKSGTANVPIPNGYDDTQVASFVGFAPLDNPQVVILVKLDENADLKTGLVAAGPVFAAMADETLAYLNVQPDDGQLVRDR